MCSYVVFQFADHSALQQVMRQFTQLAQVIVKSARTARIGAEMQRLLRYHPVSGLLTTGRRAN